MALSLTIVPCSSSVDMYGSPDQSSSYSTSGHVAISFRHPSSLFGRRRTARYQLQSLSLTFEGQSELFTLPTGYAAARLCTFTEELVRQPYELFDDGDGDTAWHVTYDLRLPGWLPPTDVFGDCDKAEPGTRYTLHATAKICSLDDAGSWLSLCSPISFRSKTFEASPCPITLNRYAMAPTVEGTWPMTCYGVVALPLELQSSRQHGIPMEIFEKLEVLISVPQRISTDESTFPLAIRIRAPRMSPEIAARFKIPEFFVSLDQCERYQSSLGSWAEQFPVAKHSTQSPHVPLRSYHPMRSLYEIGLCTTPENLTLQDTFTLLRDSHKTKYLLDGSKPIFSDLQSDAWFVMNTNVAFSGKSFEKGRWVGSRKIRPSGAGPFLDVKHTLQVSVWCVIEGTADIPEARERLQFTIPLDFVRTRAATPAAPERATEAAVIAMPPLIPYDLPVYSHLFHSNGDRKIDHLEPLPLYTSTPDELSPLLADEDLPKTPSAQ